MTLEEAIKDWPNYLEIKGSALQGMARAAEKHGLRDVAALNPVRFEATATDETLDVIGHRPADWPENAIRLTIRHFFMANGEEYITQHEKVLRASDVAFFKECGALPEDAVGRPD